FYIDLFIRKSESAHLGAICWPVQSDVAVLRSLINTRDAGSGRRSGKRCGRVDPVIPLDLRTLSLFRGVRLKRFYRVITTREMRAAVLIRKKSKAVSFFVQHKLHYGCIC